MSTTAATNAPPSFTRRNSTHRKPVLPIAAGSTIAANSAIGPSTSPWGFMRQATARIRPAGIHHRRNRNQIISAAGASISESTCPQKMEFNAIGGSSQHMLPTHSADRRPNRSHPIRATAIAVTNSNRT